MWMKRFLPALTVFAILILLVVGVLAFIVSSKPYLPPLSGGVRVSLKLSRPNKTPNPKFARFLMKPFTSTVASERLYEWGQLRYTNGWFKNVKIAQTYQKEFAPVRRKYLRLLKLRGCSFGFDRKKSNNQYYNQILLVKAVGYTALLQAQVGKPNVALPPVLFVVKHLERQIEECEKSLIMVLCMGASIQILSSVLRKIGTHPKLSAALRVRSMQLFRRMATGYNPMPDSFRTEGDYIKPALKNVWKGRGLSKPRLAVWPWWDRFNTEELLFLQYKSLIYRASLPFGPKIWLPTTTDKQLTQVLQDRNHTNETIGTLMYYNSIGLRNFFQDSSSYMKYVWKWHQIRCTFASTQAWLYDTSKTHKSPIPAATKRMLNPLTRAPFPIFSSKNKQACSVDNPVAKKQAMGEVMVYVVSWKPSFATAAKKPRPRLVKKRKKKKRKTDPKKAKPQTRKVKQR